MSRLLLGVLVFAFSSQGCTRPGSGTETGSSEASTGPDETTAAGTAETTSGTGTGESSGDTSETTTGEPEEIPCDPWVIDDCPDGMKCVPIDGETGAYNYDETVCRPVMAEPKAPGESCTMPEGPFRGYDDCDETSFCFHVDETDKGTCMPLCVGPIDSPSCPGEMVCPLDGDGVVAVCRERCDPVSPVCTAEKVTCSWSQPWFVCTGGPGSVHPDDLGPEHQGILENEVCPSLHSCAIGLGCVDAGKLSQCDGASCCRPYCDLTANDGGDSKCHPAESCKPFIQNPPADYVHVGICRL